MSDALHTLADAAGLSVEWTDYRDRRQRVDEDVLRAILSALGFDCASPAQCADSLARARHEAERGEQPLIVAQAGLPVLLPAAFADGCRYRLELESGAVREGRLAAGEPLPPVAEIGYHRLYCADTAPRTLAVAPPRCYGFADLGLGRKAWGLAAQVYALRRRGDGGIGDFGGVAGLARAAARHGADAVALSPVHALFGAWPQRYAPYAPSSRLLLNWSYADAGGVLGAAAVDAALAATGSGAERAALEALDLIDWPRAVTLKTALLRALYRGLCADPHSALHTDFRAFAREDAAAREHACFEVLHRHLFAQDSQHAHWRRWPAELRDPRAAAVMRFAQTQADEVEFELFLQWLTARSLRAAQSAARDAGMAIGLIGDLAVGTDGAGSHAWAHQREMLIGLSVGAPPDALGTQGQNWGLTAFSPHALRRSGYAAFIELLRASLRHFGGVRMDHVLGFARLWLVPEGMPATRGAYLRYPAADLFALIALESWRHRALIIGEDLGTVPDGFREALERSGVLGTRVLWFERDHGYFVEPQRWPVQAMATTSTHDLATVAGWWSGRDLDWRAQLGLFGADGDEASERAARVRDRGALWDAFVHAQVAAGPAPAQGQGGEVAQAAAAYVGRTPAQLVLLPLEDALALDEQPNIPGTLEEHPNWRRRLPGEAADLLDDPPVAARLRATALARGQ